MTAASKVLLRAALLSAAVLAAFAHTQPAAAVTPCWKTLLNDWYDGRIDRTYPKHCYTDALHHLPYLAVSKDHGATWGKPIMIAPPGVHESNFPTIDASRPGHIAIGFPGSQSTKPTDAGLSR